MAREPQFLPSEHEFKRAIFIRDGWRCQICGKKVRLGMPKGSDSAEMDHIVPKSVGGSRFDPANLRTLCRPCHREETNAHLRYLQSLPDGERRMWHQFQEAHARDGLDALWEVMKAVERRSGRASWELGL